MKRFTFWLVTFLFLIVQSEAQEKIIKGVVTTFDSIAINGATIKVNSSKETVLSDSLGNFTLSCSTNDKLKVTANGFYNQTVKIDEKIKFAAINLKLKAGDKNLEYATAYTSTSDRDKLTAVASRSGDELDLSVYSDFFEAIRGKFPGLEVSGTDLIIRGIGTINGKSPALVVLDGSVVPSSSLSALNPETVKRVNVIKDGSSAIYGSRAAFGVVEITTKKGDEMNN